ncbi:MAG: glycosyltransferase family 2 protein [Deltaproteobacteria bacterium]|nr:glycosyltransferase family 2 protein [Deltaproteobacteria bacterium]MBW1817723.1 glycosyltransferase family 2 protein [Deltaproteobacteria bacterium]
MKLLVQIPCFNEETTLPQTVRDIPRQIDGIDRVEILVVDDGSTDGTVAVARELGVDHIVKNICNKGLATTFMVGLDACLRAGADIVVNTDGDNQYSGKDIAKLVAPILNEEADMVIGDRQTDTITHFSGLKRKLQKWGSASVRMVSDTDVADAVSGFRAFSRDAAMRMNVISRFTYTIETVIQAGKTKMAVASVPVGTNPKTRRSRLIDSMPRFIGRSVATMIRTYTMYRPLKVFAFIGILFIVAGLIPSLRFLFYFFMGESGGHIQSLILAAILFIVGFQILVIGLVADIISVNRRLIEETLLRVKRIELDHFNPNRNS